MIFSVLNIIIKSYTVSFHLGLGLLINLVMPTEVHTFSPLILLCNIVRKF